MRFAFRTAALAAAAICAAGAAQAVTVGFSLTLSGNPNIPTFALTNISDRTSIETFDFSIGDASRNFDVITLGAGPSGGAATLLFGSAAQGGSSVDGGRTDTFTIGHTGFAPSLVSTLTADVDRDNINSLENYRVRFFNNGAAPNSVISVTFGSGQVLDLTLPDQAGGNTVYTFAQSVELAPIPLPAGLSLTGTALLALGFAALRRRGPAPA